MSGMNTLRVFRFWALSNGYAENLSIDRINNDGNYEPGNCKWSSTLEQANNKSTNRLITAFGETKTLAEWSRDSRCVICYNALKQRINYKWEPEKAITLPSKPSYNSKRVA